MLNLLQNAFVPKSFFEGSPLERRRSMLTYKLFVVGLCFLGVPYGVVANATFLWSILFISYLAALTGGINSQPWCG